MNVDRPVGADHPERGRDDGSPDSQPEQLAESDRPLAVDGVRVTVLEGEAVLFHEAASMVHRLGPVAGAVWVCCDGDTDVATMIDEVATAFGIEATTVAPEVHRTLERLADQGLLAGSLAPTRIHMTPVPMVADDGTEILTPPPDP